MSALQNRRVELRNEDCPARRDELSLVRGSTAQRLEIGDSISAAAKRFDGARRNERLELARDDFPDRPQLLGEPLLRHSEGNGIPTARCGDAIEKELREPASDASHSFIQSLDEVPHAHREPTIDEETNLRTFGDRRLE